jgi:hypothetical protein
MWLWNARTITSIKSIQPLSKNTKEESRSRRGILISSAGLPGKPVGNAFCLRESSRRPSNSARTF